MTEAEWDRCTDPTRMTLAILGEPVRETIVLADRGAVEYPRFPQCRGSDRQRRLFLCACCRAVDPALATDYSFRVAVETTERHFGGSATAEETVAVSKMISAEVDAHLAGDLSASAQDPPAPSNRGWREHLARLARWVSGSPALLPGPDGPPQNRFRRLALLRLAELTSQIDFGDSTAWGLDWMTDEAVRGSLTERERRDWYAQGPAICRDIFGNPFRPVTFSPEWRTDTAVALARQMYEAREFGAMPILADAIQDAGCDNPDVLEHCRGPGPHVRGCWVVDQVLGKS